MLQEFDEKEFKSVSAEDLDIGESKEEKEESEKQEEESKDLLEFMKEALEAALFFRKYLMNFCILLIFGWLRYYFRKGNVALSIRQGHFP